MTKQIAVLVLDIDGTVRKGLDELGRFVNGPEDVEVFPEALILMTRWKERGGIIIGASNQGGIALGHVTLDNVIAAFNETQQQCGGLFDRIAFCQHHPDAKDPEYARCWCRKPAPGLIIETLLRFHDDTLQPDVITPPHLALFVGDRDEDKECARILNMDFMWAKDWRATA